MGYHLDDRGIAGAGVELHNYVLITTVCVGYKVRLGFGPS